MNLVTQADELAEQVFPWGRLQWLCNGELLPGTSQTVGTCTLGPGQGNPMHYHPNCEEILHVLTGVGTHLLDAEWVPIRPGSTVRIPTGMKHQLINTGNEPLVCIIVFSSPDRQTVFL